MKCYYAAMRVAFATAIVSIFCAPTQAQPSEKAAVNPSDWKGVTAAADGMLIFHPIRNEPELNNPWPADWEKAYELRASEAIQLLAKRPFGGTTSGESEKNLYPQAIAQVLAGDRKRGLQALEQKDHDQQDHAQTAGIDYYWCFTLKGQMRKYFYLHDLLTPEHRKLMFDGGKLWTEIEPLRRPHSVYGKGKDPGVESWGPNAKGSWVDIRNTDNLRAMRDTSVYLMAEETGNEATRLLYKAKIAAYVQMLHHIGMSEWDSDNYIGHTIAPYHNLYDFAKDPEVKQLAKAALDWLYTAGAVKWWRGGTGGPTLRNYAYVGNPFGSSVDDMFELYVGDAVLPDPSPDRDFVHHVTSSYRPPVSTILLAKKQFKKPVELLATKPAYTNWKPGDPSEPMFWETSFFGETFQLGSVVCRDATEMYRWNVGPMKLMAWSEKRGVDFFQGNTEPFGKHNRLNPGDQFGQYRNKLIFLSPADAGRSVYFQFPAGAKIEDRDGVRLVQFDKTMMALWPINLGKPEAFAVKNKEGAERFPDNRFEQAKIEGGSWGGYAIEVVDGMSYADFTAAVGKLKLDLTKIADGRVTLTGIDGKTLSVTGTKSAGNALPVIERNGEKVDFSAWRDVYRVVEGENIIEQKYLSGTLKLSVDGKTFRSTVPATGKMEFENK